MDLIDKLIPHIEEDEIIFQEEGYFDEELQNEGLESEDE